MPVAERERTADSAPRLPDFCDPWVVFAAMVVAELVVVIIVMATYETPAAEWRRLTLGTLLAQWIALTSVSALCALRPVLRRCGEPGGLVLTFALVLGVTALASRLALWLDRVLQFGVAPGECCTWRFVLGNAVIAGLVTALALRYFFFQARWREQVETAANARVQALQARIRPHFLFNSMNTIANLIRARPEEAETAVEDLADLFRGALAAGETPSRVEDELERVARYLHLEKLRLGERLTVQWHCEALPPDIAIPPLSIQPLVENAIYHGIQQRADGGTVTIGARADERWLEVTVHNPLPDAGAMPITDGNRMALENVRERLAHTYGTGASLTVGPGDGGYCARLRIPRGAMPAATATKPCAC